MRFCIDPGLRHCGVAIGEEAPYKYLHHAALVRGAETGRGAEAWRFMADSLHRWLLGSWAVSALHIEIPRIYPRSDQRKGDLNDLIEVAGVAGAIAGRFNLPTTWYYPADWKGQVPKKVMTERIRKKLSAAELENVISVGAKDHNTLDAVGIFLHSVGRL